jgi:hypothetical protein
MPTLQEKLIQEFEDLQRAHPYVPYGAGVKKRAEELLKKRKHRAPGQAWNIKDSLSDDEIRLVITDALFAQEVLREFDPTFRKKGPTLSQAQEFAQNVADKYGPQLFQPMQSGSLYPKLEGTEEHRIKEGFENRKTENRGLERQADLMLSPTT